MANIISQVQIWWLDILLGTIAVFSVLMGIRKGGIGSLMSLFGWGIAIAIAFVAQPVTSDFLRDYTPVYDLIKKTVEHTLAEDIIGKNSLAMTQYLKLPEALASVVEKASKSIAYTLTESITILCINLFTFVLLAFGIKFVAFLINQVMQTARKIPVIKFMDRIFGILVGAVRGVIIVALICALLVPISSMTGSEFLAKSISGSRLTKQVYDKNYLFFIVQQVGGHKNFSGGVQ